MDSQSFDVTPFSYDILDEEAAKISKLILAVQQRCASAKGADVSRDLFDWAEEFANEGRTAEAEFLYLHAINVFERNYGVSLPSRFTTLRDFAQSLLQKVERTSKAPDVVPVVETLPINIVETNAA